jgi:NAD(P)-dependent dehydrogenase (short-subunit alcohol dehydrogenase family)
MKVIVTGSRGILGKQIVSDLKKLGKYNLLELDLKLGHDLTNEKKVIEYFKKNKAEGLINCFVLNDHITAVPSKISFLDYPLKTFTKTLNTNVTALFSVCREFIRNNNKGKIINFSSIYGLRSPKPSYYKNSHKDPAYGPSKAAVSNLTKYLAVHTKNFNINCIVPGGIENNQPNYFKKKYIEDLPTQRLMQRSEISGLIKYLLSDDSSYCTGSDFFIDGGWSAR